MGSQSSSVPIEEDIIPRQFKIHPQNPNILISILDNTILQKHTIIIDSWKSLERQKQIFHFRRCNSDLLVTAKYFGNVSHIQMCSSCYKICFYIQNCKRLFNKLENITLEKAYVYLIESMKGFQILTKKFGYFNVNSEMIVLNQQNKLKVWISENFQQTRIYQHNQLSKQFDFVRQIIRIFDSKLPVSSENNFFWNIIKKNCYRPSQQLSITDTINILINYHPNFFMCKQSPQTTRCCSVKNSLQNSYQKQKKVKKQNSLKKKPKLQFKNLQNSNHTKDFMSTKKNSVIYTENLKKRSILDIRKINQVNSINSSIQRAYYFQQRKTPNFGQVKKNLFFPENQSCYYQPVANHSQFQHSNFISNYRQNKLKTQENHPAKKPEIITLETSETARSPMSPRIKKIIEVKQTQTKKFISFEDQTHKISNKSLNSSQLANDKKYLSPDQGPINKLITVNSIAFQSGQNLTDSVII